ncbi:MAG: aspartate/glutamate racemase family protein, partial [bacterium]
MDTKKIKPINRREALAWLGAAGALGFIGSGKTGKERRKADGETLSALRGESENGESTMKTIGVLGGLGPQATMDFEARVHHAAQRLVPQFQNSGYPPMFVYYCRHPPILLNEDHSPRLPIQPDPRLLKAAQQVGALVDFMVITSNTPHLVLEQIEQAAGRKVLSMIEVTLKELQQRQWNKVGVLGLGNPIVYTRP